MKLRKEHANKLNDEKQIYSIFSLSGKAPLSLRGALATKQAPASGGIASSQSLLAMTKGEAMTGGPAIPVRVKML
jgi:hypothetical protein